MSHITDRQRDCPLDDASIDEATAHVARPRPAGEIHLVSAFVFRLGAEWLAVPTSFLDRVVEVPQVRSLPHRRGTTMAGLVNVGGDLVVHVSLAGLLGVSPEALAPGESALRHRIAKRLVVFADDRGRLSTTVDEVWGVHHHDPSQLRAVPPTLSRAPTSYTTSLLDVAGRTVGLLDAGRVMDALSVAIS